MKNISCKILTLLLISAISSPSFGMDALPMLFGELSVKDEPLFYAPKAYH